MAFVKENTKIPTYIGTIIVTLRTIDGINPPYISGQVDILTSESGVMNTRYFDLRNHLTAGQITTIESFMDSLRTKAETELL